MTWGNKTSLVLSFSTGDAIDRIFATSNNCYDYSGKFPERTSRIRHYPFKTALFPACKYQEFKTSVVDSK